MHQLLENVVDLYPGGSGERFVEGVAVNSGSPQSSVCGVGVITDVCNEINCGIDT